MARKRLAVSLTITTDQPVDSVRSTRFWGAVLGTYAVVEHVTATPVKGPLVLPRPPRTQVNRTR